MGSTLERITNRRAPPISLDAATGSAWILKQIGYLVAGERLRAIESSATTSSYHYSCGCTVRREVQSNDCAVRACPKHAKPALHMWELGHIHAILR
jgi:hypothetical protein